MDPEGETAALMGRGLCIAASRREVLALHQARHFCRLRSFQGIWVPKILEGFSSMSSFPLSGSDLDLKRLVWLDHLSFGSPASQSIVFWAWSSAQDTQFCLSS